MSTIKEQSIELLQNF